MEETQAPAGNSLQPSPPLDSLPCSSPHFLPWSHKEEDYAPCRELHASLPSLQTLDPFQPVGHSLLSLASEGDVVSTSLPPVMPE